MRSWRRPVVCAAAALLAGCARGPGSARIVVDTATRYQTITGWEVTAQAGEATPAFPLYRDTLIALALDQLGISRLRLEVRSGVEHTRDYWAEGQAHRLTGDAYRCARYETVNDNADPRLIDWRGFHFSELDHVVESLVQPLRHAAQARGRGLPITLTYVGFFRQCPAGRRYDHRHVEEYAEFVLATVLHLRDRFGMVPDLWEVILEPDNTDDWSGARIGEAIVAAAARLREHGIAMRFVAPSNTSMAGAVRTYDQLVRVPGARAELAELAYHRYRGVSRDALRAIASRGARDSVRTAMLEHIGSGVDDLLEDLTIGNVSAWQQFVLAYPARDDDGGMAYLVDVRDPARPRVRAGSRTPMLGQVFRAVPTGSVRLGTANGQEAAVAFRAPNGGLVTVVRTRRPMDLLIDGLAAGGYAISYTGESGVTGRLPDATVAAGGTVRVAMPSAGVVTIISR